MRALRCPQRSFLTGLARFPWAGQPRTDPRNQKTPHHLVIVPKHLDAPVRPDVVF